jgi:hypothetical protein
VAQHEVLQWESNDHHGTKGDTNDKDTPQAKTPDNVREDSELEESVDAPVHDAGLKPILPNSTDVDQTNGISTREAISRSETMA